MLGREHERATRQALREPAPPRPEPPVGNYALQRMAHERRVSATMLTALGNQAVQRALGGRTIQRAPKTADEMVQLTVGDFDTHRKGQQMDWANAGFDKLTRDVLWDIVDWGLDGLATFKIDDILKEVRASRANLEHLKAYCQALGGSLGGTPTVDLTAVGTLDGAMKHGRWIREITKTLGGPLTRAVMPDEKFKALVEDETVATQFVEYFKGYNPILQAPDGKDTWAFIQLVKSDKEAGKVADYKGLRPHLHNIHKFE